MSHRRRMRSKSLRTAEAHRELDHFKLIQDGKSFGLTAPHFEAESGAWTLALALEDWTIGMALRQESQIPDRRDLRMSIEERCNFARAFRRRHHSELQGLERTHQQPTGMRIAHRAQDRAHATDRLQYSGRSRTSAGNQVGMASDIFSKRRDDQVGAMCQRGLIERSQ